MLSKPQNICTPRDTRHLPRRWRTFPNLTRGLPRKGLEQDMRYRTTTALPRYRCAYHFTHKRHTHAAAYRAWRSSRAVRTHVATPQLCYAHLPAYAALKPLRSDMPGRASAAPPPPLHTTLYHHTTVWFLRCHRWFARYASGQRSAASRRLALAYIYCSYATRVRPARTTRKPLFPPARYAPHHYSTNIACFCF